MASSLILAVAVAMIFSPAAAQTCKSQIFSNHNASFANCEDLPTLKASLHWTYDPSARPDPTLAIAFVAPPAKPDGWIAWALNPTAAGMVGSQALIAFRDTNGSIVVKTYNISSYGPIAESKIRYNVLNKRAESSNGTMRIFATLALPSAGASVSQVWQVGASVANGVPAKHDFSPENLKSTGTLRLISSSSGDKNGSAPATSPAPESGSWRVGCNGVWVYGITALLGVVLGF
ncbi:auxin-induced in root cultures protein 12 [Andrographis paniculata]|uniref:auxin-induced in root cultures protein 12 n=1 Tax=Andrographis paniculata TaxID=175694 RepID=UPI0021E80F03|nr:auxin-induced in root cultures protein 12 [Andrographis paniculata]